MENLIKFFEEISRFKHTPRRGWELRGVKNPESTADHNFRLFLIAWIMPRVKNYDIDIERVLSLILFHDLYRLYYGDDTPYDSLIKKDEPGKEVFETWPAHQKEDRILKNYEKKLEDLKKLIAPLPVNLRDDILDLWEEFEKGVSKEAKFVRQLDRLETLMQAIHYERAGEPVKAYPFWREVKEFVDDPVLLEFMEEIDKYYYLSHKK